MYSKALKIAGIAHKGQKRHCGQMYIFHPWRVSNSFNYMLIQKKIPLRWWDAGDFEECKTIAILHDVVEDTSIRLKDLKKFRFNKAVIHGVDAMTRREDESYKPYIRRLARSSEYAIYVKLADIYDNLPDCKETLRPRYEWAISYLRKQL